MPEKVSRQEAAAAVEEILVTPRVLNTERYARLVEELGSLVRAAASQSGAMSAAADDLRIAQVSASRTLEELRTRTETLGRSVAAIDQRLARSESLLARAVEQVQAAQEAAARVERLASADFGEMEGRLREAERGALARVDAASQEVLASVRTRSEEIASVIEALARDCAARATTGASEAAHRAATIAAEGVVSKSATRLEARAAELSASLDARSSAIGASLERAAAESADRIERASRESAERMSSETNAATAACEGARRDLEPILERAEVLGRTETMEPVRAVVRELGEGIASAESIGADLRDLLARVDEARSGIEEAIARASASDATGSAPSREPASNAEAVSTLEARSNALLRETDDRLRGATAHAEQLGRWLGQLLEHAQHTGAALDALVRRAEAQRARES